MAAPSRTTFVSVLHSIVSHYKTETITSLPLQQFPTLSLNYNHHHIYRPTMKWIAITNH
jgi:hypothetical protein